MRRIPAFLGEFGLRIRFFAPYVNTICLREPTVVEIEPGDEALFPNAAKYEYVDRVDDYGRGAKARPPDLEVEPTFFAPRAAELQLREIFDVVVAPRKREYGSAKNWSAWPVLTEWVAGDGYDVFAAGAPDSSYDVPCLWAWRFDRFLDASIEAIRGARLVVATDAGIAHLAVACGTPLLIVTYRGLVAPGAVYDSTGRLARPEYWPVRVDEYYEKANHAGIAIETIDGWDKPDDVRTRVAELLS